MEDFYRLGFQCRGDSLTRIGERVADAKLVGWPVLLWVVHSLPDMEERCRLWRRLPRRIELTLSPQPSQCDPPRPTSGGITYRLCLGIGEGEGRQVEYGFVKCGGQRDVLEQAARSRDGMRWELWIEFGRVGVPVGEERPFAGYVGLFSCAKPLLGEHGFTNARHSHFARLDFYDVAVVAERQGEGPW
jgi:hypothetical protein